MIIKNMNMKDKSVRYTKVVGSMSRSEEQKACLYPLRGWSGIKRLIGKRVVDFLLVLIKLFVTAEALRANIGSKSAISLQRGPVDPTF